MSNNKPDLIHADRRTYKASWICPVCYIDCYNDPVFLQSHLTGGHSKEDLERYIFWNHIEHWEVVKEDGV